MATRQQQSLRGKLAAVFILAALAVWGTAQAQLTLRGVDYGSAAFNSGTLPGVHGTNYIYPATEYGYNNTAYYTGLGMNVFRVSFLWERLQPNGAGTALDSAELARLTTTVDDIIAQGGTVILDPHNYARYYGDVVGVDIPVSTFEDFWTRLATPFAGNAKVIFGLMNEPHGMPTETWVADANAAIQAIRDAGADNLILVPGNGYTGAYSWYATWYGTANATAMLDIVDPDDNFAIEVHQYLDSDSSGTHEACVSDTIGSERMASFTSWARANGYRAFLGEFGGGDSSTCLAALADLAQYLQDNDDVYLGWSAWGAGPWWSTSYFMRLDPIDGVDQPQVETLAAYTGETTTVYQAVDMNPANGAAQGDGWKLWSNGSFSTTHDFLGTDGTITVHASGSAVDGVYSHMTVSAGGVTLGDTYLTSDLADYSFAFSGLEGEQSIVVQFDNDRKAGSEDRNLLVTTVTVIE